jgi:uncharacterized protein
MLILLPPSEGKTQPSRGPSLRMSALSFPELMPTRDGVLSALERLSTGPASKARRVLGISAKQDAELERNGRIRTSPTAPASEVYSGVLYEALGLASLSAAARRRAATDIIIASALFGLMRVTDRIPAYRLSADTTLPRVGRLAAAWRDPQQAAITAASGRGIVVDLRSSAYVGLGPVPSTLCDRAASVRVLQERAGRRMVVSHHNKATKGRLVRALLGVPQARTIEGLATSIEALGYGVELQRPKREGIPPTLDVIVSEL